MPILDTLKSALTDHLATLVSQITLGSSGGDSSSRDGGAGDTALDTPAYRATFMPITKDATNEIKVDVLIEVR